MNILKNRQNEFLYGLKKGPVLISGIGIEYLLDFIRELQRKQWLSGFAVPLITDNVRAKADQLSQWSKYVGYVLPFEEKVDGSTKIKCMSGETLVNEALTDPLLRQYNLIVMEQVEQRILWTDIVCGVLKKVLKKRSDLKIVLHTPILSDSAEQVAKFFDAAVLSTDVIIPTADTLYLKESVASYIEECLRIVLRIHKREQPGDVVVFVANKTEQRQLLKLLQNSEQAPFFYVFEHYLDMPRESKETLFDQTDKRRIILTTETDFELYSKGQVKYVVDTGFTQSKWYDYKTREWSEIIHPISKPLAELRRSLAGAKCYRLYTEEAAHSLLSNSEIPQVLRFRLVEPLLRLKALGIDNVVRSFPFVSAPSAEAVAASINELYLLGVLDDNGKMTTAGSVVGELPLGLYIGRAIAFAASDGCLDEMLWIAAGVVMGGLSSLYFRPSALSERQEADAEHAKFMVAEGDYLTMLNIISGYNAGPRIPRWAVTRYLNYKTLQSIHNVYRQLRMIIDRLHVHIVASDSNVIQSLQQCLAKSHFLQVARYADGKWLVMTPIEPIEAVPDSSSVMSSTWYRKVKPPGHWVVYEELIESGGKRFLKGINHVDRSDIMSSGYYRAD